MSEAHLRERLVAAVNGNPITADEAWALLHEWDRRTCEHQFTTASDNNWTGDYAVCMKCGYRP